ncbi:MAG: lipopolysaccharide heptosyltransferase II [Pseudomonadota bacterium]
MKPDWSEAQEILCVRLDSIGDVLMTTPALRALKTSRPGRRITLLTSRAGTRLAPLIPEVDEAIEFDAPWMKATDSDLTHDGALIAHLAARGFDAAVVFTVYSQNPLPAAYLCYLAGIPLRLAHCRENPYRLLTEWVPEIEPDTLVRHEVRRQLDLVAAVGCTTADERLSFHVPRRTRTRVARYLREIGVDPARPLIVAHPGASAASRRYPPASFAQAARLLAEAGCQIAFTGSREEIALVASVQEMMDAPSWSLAGALDLAELGAVIGAADAVVTNNSSPAHIAAALGTPVVDLYALTNPQHTPWRVESRVLFQDVPCKYCYKSICPAGHHDCLRLVAPARVAAAAMELLTAGGRAADIAAGLPSLAGSVQGEDA